MKKYMLKCILDFISEYWSEFEAFCEDREMDAEEIRDNLEEI